MAASTTSASDARVSQITLTGVDHVLQDLANLLLQATFAKTEIGMEHQEACTDDRLRHVIRPLIEKLEKDYNVCT